MQGNVFVVVVGEELRRKSRTSTKHCHRGGLPALLTMSFLAEVDITKAAAQDHAQSCHQ